LNQVYCIIYEDQLEEEEEEQEQETKTELTTNQVF
jgi:hypothetical protein